MTPETHASLRQKILEQALHLVSRDGAQGITMRALAQQLGYSPATIYLYFRNKEDLLQEIARHAANRLMDATAGCVEMENAAAARDAFARAMLQFAIGQPRLYHALASIDVTPYLADPSLESPGRRLIDRYRDLYARGAAAGQLRSQNPEHDVIIDWSLLHGFLGLVLSGSYPPPRLPDVTVEDLQDVILDAIRTRTAL